ncbi:hypothetical protein FNV43_RR20099 [Rhamnella rubrinervis]|uniref:Uncharacterized protein n=1 Tax=Rhamnella rubrinervis TaxID=2594499 RepID=A0A8K0DVA9_9ROSA|nr:hypothetical protein FNV43_RR20099 [Rhamnella rubrinervis]
MELDINPYLTRIEDLKVVGCKEKMSLWRDKLHQLTSLRCLEIENSFEHLTLVGEETGQIRSCDALECLSSDKLPETLEHLEIKECGRLMSLSSKEELPQALKHLLISDCGKLESIRDRFHDNTCLESIKIIDCPKLKSLPEGLCHLTNLDNLHITWCDSLVSFPGGGLRTSNLRDLAVTLCNRLEAFPKGMNNLSSLHTLSISYCDGFTSILEDGFPPNLTSLFIWNLKVSKPLFKWGLGRLTSLRELVINGKATDMVSFPPEDQKGMMILPKSLIDLKIFGFPMGLSASPRLNILLLVPVESLNPFPRRVYLFRF